jgi:hypothetical protein
MIDSLLRRPILLLVLGVAWLTFECWALGPWSYLEQQDTGNLFVPMLHAVGRGGPDVGDWYPLAGGGLDLLASGTFVEPFNVLFRLLPTWLAYSLLVVGVAALGAGGVYALGRSALGLSAEAAAAAGLAFAAIPGASTIYWFGLTAFPAYLLALRYGALSDAAASRRWAVAISASLAFALVIEPQFLIPFPFLWVGLWFVLVEPLRKPERWVLLVVAALAALFPHLEQIVSLMGYGPLSSRYGAALASDYATLLVEAIQDFFGTPFRLLYYASAPIRATEISEPTRNAVQLLAYGVGIAGLVLAARLRAMAWRLVAVLLAAWLACLLALAIQKTVGPSFPLLAGYGLTRIRAFETSIYVLLLGLGLQGLIEAARQGGDDALYGRRLRIGAALFAIGFLVYSGAQKARNVVAYFAETSRRYAAASAPLEALATKIKADGEPARVMAVRFSPNWLAYHPGLEAAGAYQSIVLRRYKDLSMLWRRPEAGRSWREGSLWEIDFLIDSEADGVLRLDRVARLPLLSLANVRYVVSLDPIEGAGLSHVMGDAKPWSLLSTRERLARRLEENLVGARALYVYRNDQALPRFFVVHEARRFASGAEVLAALADADVATLGRTAFVEAGDVPEDALDPAATGGGGTGSVRIESYGADRIALDVVSSRKGLLVVLNSHSPYWQATVDGTAAPYVPAYHAFAAVPVPAGASKVVLRYAPPYSAWRR